MVRRISTAEKILESASVLFFEQGFSNVSVDAIALAAATTKVTVYQHFRSKEEIFVTCLGQRLAARDASLALQFDNRTMNSDMLLEFFDWMKASAKKNRFLGCAYLKAVNELAERLPEVRQIARRAKHSLRKRIIRVAAASNLKDPEELGNQLAVLLEGAQSLSLIERSARPFMPARRAAITLLLAHGWSPASKCLQTQLEKCR